MRLRNHDNIGLSPDGKESSIPDEGNRFSAVLVIPTCGVKDQVATWTVLKGGRRMIVMCIEAYTYIHIYLVLQRKVVWSHALSILNYHQHLYLLYKRTTPYTYVCLQRVW